MIMAETSEAYLIPATRSEGWRIFHIPLTNHFFSVNYSSKQTEDLPEEF